MIGRTQPRTNISNEALPEPIMMAARSSVTGVGPLARIFPTLCLLEDAKTFLSCLPKASTDDLL